MLLENEEGMEANLVITKDTYFINDEEIIKGSEVTGYYKAGDMMIMIYPPQYEAVAVLVTNRKQNIKVDLFDENLISADNTLKLNVDKNTKIFSKDGKEYKGDLANRKLVVFYQVSTRSIPAHTNPDKIVVLSDPIVPDEDKNSYYGSFTGTVTKITNLKDSKDKKQITLRDEEGIEALFTISKSTYQTNNEEIKVGSVVTAYYDAKVFRILIYPAQYEAEVVDVEKTKHNIKVDYFDNKLTSADGSLTLKIGKKTEIIYKDGVKYNGKPVKSNLIVIYDRATKSIPAQTEPLKIIVLEDSKGKPKDKDNQVGENDSKYWKDKLDEWMKLTDELIDNRDKLSDYKEDIYKYVWKLVIRPDNSWKMWNKGFGNYKPRNK